MRFLTAIVLLLSAPLAMTGCVPPASESGASASSLGDAPATPSRYPIVLVHGFNASPNSPRTFSRRIVEHFRSIGQKVWVARLTPYASSAYRASELLEEIRAAQAEFGAAQVHIVAHSQAGLDARILASPMGLDASSAIRSITTLSTPHHGTAIADLALHFVGDGGLSLAIETWLQDILVGSLDTVAQAACHAGECNMSSALEDMQERGFEARFNAAYPDAPSVLYQSVAGVSTHIYGPVDGTGCGVAAADDLSPETTRLIASHAYDDMTTTLRFSSEPVGHHRAEPNDGIVRVESSKWGWFRGCLFTDHYGLIDQGRYRERADYDNGFDVLTFYDRLVSDLAARE